LGAFLTSERVERRLAAVLAADVAGYSRLMGLAEERTLANLKSFRKTLVDPAIAAHRGRIVKTTGDGLLVEFASAVDAARCAVEVQRGMAEQNSNVPQDTRIEFRIGIHIGDIIVDDNDIFGDGVNIAARLEGIAEPGGICISDDAHRQIRGKVDIAFEDMGSQTLKNIAEPMRAWRMQVGGASAAPSITRKEAAVSSGPQLALPDKPSIAVLPFQNMSGDPEQDYFADGMVEDIITALSRIRWLFVIARNSSFTYKGRSVDIKQVGRELGVHYVLEGSVRKSGARLRITGQLIDALTGAHLWADRFDGSIEDVFDLQDRVAISVAGVIEPALLAAELNRSIARPTGNLSAYDFYLRATALMGHWSKDQGIEALDLLRQAIALDPNYGLALAAASWCQAQLYICGWAPDLEIARRESLEFARRAVQTAPDDSGALGLVAGALHSVGEPIDGAIALIERSTSLNPGSAFGWFWSGFLRLFAGSTEMSIEHFETSLRLDPRTPLRPFLDTGIAACYFFQRRFEEAVALLVPSLRQVPTYVTTSWILVSCYAHMGRLDEAREIVAHLRKITPSVMPPKTLFLNSTQREFLFAGLHLAGLPE
jgi:TolB-like protein/class 3 adenylate cyclase/tetratricopeptide (TPR) repeat protein